MAWLPLVSSWLKKHIKMCLSSRLLSFFDDYHLQCAMFQAMASDAGSTQQIKHSFKPKLPTYLFYAKIFLIFQIKRGLILVTFHPPQAWPSTPTQEIHNRTDAVIHTMAATQLPRCWHTLHMWSFLGTVHFEQVKTEYICTCFRNITNQFLPQWWLLYKRHYKL